VIDAELAQGADFDDAYVSDDLSAAELMTELSGEVFGQDVVITVACSDQGLLRRVHYVVESHDPALTGAVFAQFAGELDTLFGEPTAEYQENSRSLHYICPVSSPVMLQEDILAEEEHEVYLAVDPKAITCLQSVTP
jgi:hypothetical protein